MACSLEDFQDLESGEASCGIAGACRIIASRGRGFYERNQRDGVGGFDLLGQGLLRSIAKRTSHGRMHEMPSGAQQTERGDDSQTGTPTKRRHINFPS
jgi:hypothetical protein